jgi:hypothetical protein
MNHLEDFNAFIGRIGNLYVKKNICSPFDIRRYAQGWWGDGIAPAYCFDQISLHLENESDQYYSGSGDRGIVRVDKMIRETWKRLEPARSRTLLDLGNPDE